jgi:DNA-binding response OmpR family regulator
MSIQHSERKKFILIGDDEQWYAGPIRDALAYEGYLISAARTGSEVLAKIKAERLDLVILDVMMNPGDLEGDHANGTRTGRVVLEKVRGDLGLDAKTLPVICLTVLRDENLRDTMTRLGADYLCKENAPLENIIKAVRKKIGT